MIATEEDAGRLMTTTVTKWLKPLADSTVLVTSAVYGALLVLSVRAGLFGIWLLILLGLSLWRYAYAVLSGVAQGRARLPPPSIESMNPVGNVTLIAHFALFPGLAIFIDRLAPIGAGTGGEVLGAGLVMVLAGVFPASAAIMSLTSNLAAALNPSELASFVRTLGRDYALLLGAGVGLVSITLLVQRVVVPRFGLLSALAAAGLAIWAMLGVFALIGAAIHAHRDDFDIPGEQRKPVDRDREDLRRAWRAELDLAYASIRSGELDKGYQTLRNLIATNGGSVEIQYWLFENMIDWEDRTHAFRVAERLVARLVEIGDLPAALELFLRCRHAGTAPDISPQALRRLAEYAQGAGQTGLASELRAKLDASGSYSV